MLKNVLAFFLGTLLIHFACATLPDLRYFGVWVLILALCSLWQRRLFWLVMAFGLGALYALLSAQARLAVALPDDLEGKNVVVEGYITSIPSVQARSIRFEFDIVKWSDQYFSPGSEVSSPILLPPMRVRLNVYDPLRAQSTWLPGQRLILTVRLKQPHGFMNQGGFDYEQWLFAHNLRATGYVREQHAASFDNHYQLLRLRFAVYQQLQTLLHDIPQAAVITALALGESGDLDDQQWQLLRDTGTTHLISISGLHVGLLLLLVYHALQWLFRRIWPPATFWTAQQVAMCGGLLAAFLYVELAAFSVPTQRSLLMLLLPCIYIMWRKQLAATHCYAVALLVVLLWDPFTPLQIGFWLSFIAVAVLLWLAMRQRVASTSLVAAQSTSLWRLRAQSFAQSLWTFSRLQIFLLLVLLPLTLFVFGKASFIGGIANFFAIPLVGLVVVPNILLALLIMPISAEAAHALLYVANILLELLWWGLSWVSQLPWAVWPLTLPFAMVWPGLVFATILIMMPAGWGWRLPGLLLYVTLLLWPAPRLQPGQLMVHVLDVGQGTAVFLQTAKHNLLYDTGAHFGENSDAAQVVILPFLQTQGVTHLDRLVVSHADDDHAGGVQSILSNLPVTDVWLGEWLKTPLATKTNMTFCQVGQQWQWDEVSFEILWPEGEQYVGNNQSCVLKVSVGTQAILLTGDIEAPAEEALLSAATDVRATIIVVPHHGSRSSSTPEFVKAVQAELAVATTGYRNRYRFPREEVMQRYSDNGAVWLNTATVGAVGILLDAAHWQLQYRWRLNHPHYWQHPAIAE
ncbi:MAG: DNA internalization-related competence protein ComEC/Rec2 [Gammaproteobacteria bacterium]|nr:DNA internalization-related competence protein ComEC/Rec2 [Gammaproteobacteria bacterium]